MDTAPLTPTQTSVPTRAAPAAESGFAQTDYMTFLRMLTVQMQNQDPLNPMSSTDFAVQLATFSSVEQQTQTNQLLQSMLGRMGLSDLGGWIGMEVRSAAGAWFDGAPVTLDPALPAGADRGILLVRNTSGGIVDTIELSPGTDRLEWDGQTLDGGVAPDGIYLFTLEAYRGGELVDSADVPAYQLVTEARQTDTGIELVLAGGMRVDSAQVTGLRRPPEG